MIQCNHTLTRQTRLFDLLCIIFLCQDDFVKGSHYQNRNKKSITGSGCWQEQFSVWECFRADNFVAGEANKRMATQNQNFRITLIANAPHKVCFANQWRHYTACFVLPCLQPLARGRRIFTFYGFPVGSYSLEKPTNKALSRKYPQGRKCAQYGDKLFGSVK